MYSNTKEPLIHTITWMNLKDTMLSERNLVSKVYILHYSIYLTFSKRQKCWKTNQRLPEVIDRGRNDHKDAVSIDLLRSWNYFIR